MAILAPMTVAILDGYIDPIKLLVIIVMLFLWAKLLPWVDKDAEAAHLPRQGLNMMNMGVFVAAHVAFIFLPNFYIALGVYLFLFLACTGVYLGLRNKQVGLADLKKKLFAKKKSDSSKNAAKAAGSGEVTILAKDGPVMMPDDDEPTRPLFDSMQTLMGDPLRKDAERIELRPDGGGYVAYYWVDGVAYELPNFTAEVGAGCIGYIKGFAGMDVEDRRKPQSGKMKVSVGRSRYDIDLATAGSTAGESMRIGIDTKKRLNHRLDNLGLADDQLAKIRDLVQMNQGIVLVASPKQQGLTTMLYSLVRTHDAFLQHIQSIERVPREELEGVTQIKLGANSGPTEEFKQVEWAVSQQPDVILLDEVVNSNSAKELIQFAASGKRAYIGMRAGSTFEALEQWRKLIGDDALASSALAFLMSGRVLRRLCVACKVQYQPDPEQLRKMNMDPARISSLYQARTQPLTDPKGRPIPCTFCNDLRFKSRFGVYETFNVDDEVRQLIASRAPGERNEEGVPQAAEPVSAGDRAGASGSRRNQRPGSSAGHEVGFNQEITITRD